MKSDFSSKDLKSLFQRYPVAPAVSSTVLEYLIFNALKNAGIEVELFLFHCLALEDAGERKYISAVTEKKIYSVKKKGNTSVMRVFSTQSLNWKNLKMMASLKEINGFSKKELSLNIA